MVGRYGFTNRYGSADIVRPMRGDGIRECPCEQTELLSMRAVLITKVHTGIDPTRNKPLQNECRG